MGWRNICSWFSNSWREAVVTKIYDILYITNDGQHRKMEIGAFDVRGAINSSLEMRKDISRVISAKPQEEWK